MVATVSHTPPPPAHGRPARRHGRELTDGHRARRVRQRPPVRLCQREVAISATTAVKEQRAVVCLINEQRIERGLPKLVANRKLDLSAQRWTNGMVSNGNFSHGAGTAFTARIAAAGFNWENAAENIATGYSTPAGRRHGMDAEPGPLREHPESALPEVGTGIDNSVIRGSSTINGTWTRTSAGSWASPRCRTTSARPRAATARAGRLRLPREAPFLGGPHADHPQLAGHQPGPADWFTGAVFVDPVAAPSPPSRAAAASVHFTPGARTAWHTHPLGQTIFVTEGQGLCQREGGPIEEIRPGDRVYFEPGENHWHGAGRRASWLISRFRRPATTAAR